MNTRTIFRNGLRPLYKSNDTIYRALKEADETVDLIRHTVAPILPQLIRADPRSLYITLTANCDNRCMGCHYGREFMHGHQLPLQTVKDLLDDAKELGFERVRLYGGEPLLHKDLPAIIEHTVNLGLKFWMTTNGVQLKKKIDTIFAAGLRHLSIGLYGIGEEYDNYVQFPRRYEKVVAGVEYTREKYGQTIAMHWDWLLMRPTCNSETVAETLKLAVRYEMPIYVNLVHYSLPYFVGREKKELHFNEADRAELETTVNDLIAFKQERPDLLLNSVTGLRAIPDWLLKGANMRVPCTEYRLIWIGADGSVQMCYVTFKLGNLHENRLSELLFTPEHEKAARDAFQLNCPNCHCSYDKRTLRYGPTRRLYGLT